MMLILENKIISLMIALEIIKYYGDIKVFSDLLRSLEVYKKAYSFDRNFYLESCGISNDWTAWGR